MRKYMQNYKSCPEAMEFFEIAEHLELTDDDKIILVCPYCGGNHKIPGYDFEYHRPRLEKEHEETKRQWAEFRRRRSLVKETE